MNTEAQLDQLLREIRRAQSALLLLQARASNLGQFIHCCICDVRVLIPGGQPTPRGWLAKWCHDREETEYFCPDNWDSACLDNTDSWFSGGQDIRLPFDEAHNLDKDEWRRIKTQFGAN